MEELLKNVLEEFKVNSEEELLNKTRTNDFIKKVEDGLFSYDDFICLGYLDLDEIVETIGVTNALSQGIISRSEFEEYRKTGVLTLI